jgi:hypothetical protein
MDTSAVVESAGRRTHRRHGADFKAQVIRACRQPGVSIAAVALANGLNRGPKQASAPRSSDAHDT